ncbi:efflux RND transporter periplasmic adaptor subunit [Bacterioplanoides sp.]|uniref:efflux RND transporter periplasmic adaptor subunit n=1 Tax=Bacterioplanoides sp. TaxID=2066072 RepID=UPI003B0017FD
MTTFKFRQLLHAVLISAFLLPISSAVSAGGDHGHGHDDHHEEEAKGPNGGKLLNDGDFALELTIFEVGIPAEMRIFAYDHGSAIAPQQFTVSVTLNRLGGAQDNITFSPERDYRVGNQIIAEPHSYDVTVNASFAGKQYHWQFESHEGRAEIPLRLATLSGIKTELAAAQTITQKDTLFGVISAAQDKVFHLHAPYSSIVEKVQVQVGDTVTKGQTLMRLKNTETLQTYALKSPVNGEITELTVNQGDRADSQALMQISDLSRVWVNLSAFPENIEKLRIGQNVDVYDMHDHEHAFGSIEYVAPQMTGGHIARARAVIDNRDGHWRPGMHIKADIKTSERQVPLAVKTSALQRFRDMPVVFAKYDNHYEVRMLEMGEQNDDWIEVLGGLEPGTEYVTENSFLLKADVLKDGASHDH